MWGEDPKSVIDMPDVGGGEEESEQWLTTFADLSMLLLVFFILLFTMSTLDEKKFTDSFTAVKQALGSDNEMLMSARLEQDEAVILESVRLKKQLIEAQKKVYAEIRTFLNTKGVEGVVGSVFDEGVITLKVPGDVLFKKGEVELNPAGKQMLQTFKEFFIQRKDQMINIKGYTDDSAPLATSRFKDNWEISALRAVNVLRFFLENSFEPVRLSATGLADLDPLFPNTTPANRAKNRRVEFVLEKRIGGDN